MSKKKNRKQSSPKEDAPAPVEETETITEEATDSIVEQTEPEVVEDTKPEPAETKKQKSKRKIDFVFCSKCGFQSTELDTKSCPTCKNDLTPAYSSNPQG